MKHEAAKQLPPKSPRDSTFQFFKVVRSIRSNQPSQPFQLPNEDANPFMKLTSVLRDVGKVLEARGLNQGVELDWGQSIGYFQQRALESCKGIPPETQSQADCLNTA